MDPKRPSPSVVLLALLFAVGAGGCGERTKVPPPIPNATAVPHVCVVRPEGRSSLLPEPHDRYPAGTRLEWGAEVGDGARRSLAAGFFAMGAPAATRAGDGVLFLAKEGREDAFAVWLSRPVGAEPRRLFRHPGDVGSVAELPDGRFVYSGVVAGAPVIPGMRFRWALFVRGPGDSPARRITFGAGCDVDPILLRDGRILYASWQPDGGMYLWTVHPDGTGASRLPGPHGGTPFAVRPERVDDDTVRYVLRGPDLEGGAFVVDLRAPGVGAPSSVPVPANEQIIAPQPAQGHLSLVDPAKSHGTLLGLDVSTRHADARALRLRRYDDGRVLGEVALAEDGSFFVRVPADTSLVVDLLDHEGVVLASQQTPFWVRSNEVRACVGCHHEEATAPRNHRPLAVLRDPVLVGEGDR